MSAGSNHGHVFPSEQAVRDWLAGSMFQFMFDRTCFFALPCNACRGFHVVTLPTDCPPEKREARKPPHAQSRSR